MFKRSFPVISSCLPRFRYSSNNQMGPFSSGTGNPKYVEADDAVRIIESGDTVFVHSLASTPLKLVQSLAQHGRQSQLQNVSVCHILTEGPAEYMRPEFKGIFRSNSFFIGANAREAVNSGRADYVPIFLSEIPELFQQKLIQLDVALIQVSPPDKHGFCSLGTNIDVSISAIRNAKYIIAQVNSKVPRTFGDGLIHISRINSIVESDSELPERKFAKPNPVEEAIGKTIAENLVENGATLQMGIGSIPDAVLRFLRNHKNLGIHSEMFSDGVIDLIQDGCITNCQKKILPGKIVGSFCHGTRRLYDFLDNNPNIVMGDVQWVNDSSLIAKNPKVTAINSCIEIDLTGQVVSDSIGFKLYSGFGGQVDFLRGAALCKDGGKPILALPSTTKKGESKVVPFLKKGIPNGVLISFRSPNLRYLACESVTPYSMVQRIARSQGVGIIGFCPYEALAIRSGVVTTRAHVRYVVTEYGYANLFGKNLRQRAYELIRIAHPDHRETLEKAAFQQLGCMPSP